MNVAFFLTPKNEVAYLYNDFTFRQGLEKMKYHGYTAIPVITKEGKYVGTVSEGDFLWYFVDKNVNKMKFSDRKIEKISINEILKTEKYKAVKITESIDELVSLSLNQNFVPIVDDTDNFIGIVLRKDIIKYFSSGKVAVTTANKEV
ncbi:MAG: CBS domain-containing protein [Acutalibacteraceae bacterium]